ncbi:SET domain-containing protein [Leucogyrophana mollusca]|uniref:SET domain-containing protein n=1 Tax=Leucogyrophana mollusca TaxID=85980 RepID=A0ACB8B8N1_9AGAM|nr:SET domain-containing protein [Leucogyrophana mollusca]
MPLHILFLEVWKEYWEWDKQHCRDVLQSFSSVGGSDDHETGLRGIENLFALPPKASSPAKEAAPSGGSHLSASTTQYFNVNTITAEEFPPHKPYESCSPLPRTIFKGDDADEMPFIPYADEEDFDFLDHTLCYESFAWQSNRINPDYIVILEAAHRLYTQHSISYPAIDNTCALPRKLSSTPSKTGLVSLSRRRDIPNWTPAVTDLRARLNSVQSLFCSNLNCVQMLCPVHVESNPIPPPKQPKASLADILSQVKDPCGSDCFLHTSEVKSPPTWTEADTDNLKAVFEIMPDSPPCHLAVMCFKPCREWRSRRNEPCHHEGPCNSRSKCPCSKNRSHCLRNCQCSADCARRWRGCRCGVTKVGTSCISERCPCVVAHRECDPELCQKCECSTALRRRVIDPDCSFDICVTASVQELEVKNSRWGLGAFLKEPAKQGDLISEYVGELIYEPTFDSRGQLSDYRGRSYAFGLDRTFSLDSSYLGNASRFIDHARSSSSQGLRPNCRAHVRLVNGEHRIGIFASEDMVEGTEALIDYGPAFFTDEAEVPDCN